jgi:hypothetical protein
MKFLNFYFRFAIYSIFSLLLLSCSQPTEPDTKPTLNGRTYNNPKLKFSLLAPEGWTLSMDQKVGNLTAPIVGVKNEYMNYQPNFSVLAEVHSGSEDINLLLDVAEFTIKETFDNVTIVSKSTVNISNKTCGSLVFKVIMNGFEFRIKQLYIIHNKYDFIITFSALETQYKAVESEFSFIQRSIRLY